MQICNENTCTGCLACMNRCPKDAITVGRGENGQIMPCIDAEKCINCGICQKICPANTKLPLCAAERSYAAWSTADGESSSGGVAAVMARRVLSRGGVVYGAAVANKVTRHIRVTEEAGLALLRGSKYVQSEVGLSYRQAKEDLQKELPVLFVGTPCQIAGLKAFLNREYTNLIAVDLICHGTPPHQYLTEHLDRKTRWNWDGYSFRGKHDFSMTAYCGENIVYQQYCSEDFYFQAFLQGLTYRESCYLCSYARPERVSDLTIGDFWGIKRATLQQPYKGRISVVLPNTEKGQAFLDEIKPELVWEERTFEEATNEDQGNLLHPSTPHEDRALFLQWYKKTGDFDKAIQKTPFGKELQRKYRLPPLPVRAINKVKRMLLGRTHK